MTGQDALDRQEDTRGAGPTLVINGERVVTRAQTMAALLEEQGYAGRKVATALNGDFVPEKSRTETHLKAGDAVEIVAPRQGG